MAVHVASRRESRGRFPLGINELLPEDKQRVGTPSVGGAIVTSNGHSSWDRAITIPMATSAAPLAILLELSACWMRSNPAGRLPADSLTFVPDP